MGKRSTSKRSINKSKRLLVGAAIVIAIALITFLFLNYENGKEILLDKKTQSDTSEINTRKVYDYEKILQKPFLTFEDKQAGFSIQHPSEMEVERPTESEGEIVFSLVAQHFPEIGKIDGLLMKFFFYDNDDNSFPHTSEQLNPYTDNEFHRRAVEEITISGYKSWKVTSCCYDGESIIYYVLNERGDRYLRIDVYPMGQDQEQYPRVIERMLGTVRFVE